MKKKSITFKLFIITSLFFILFTSITMLLQTLFIENFYLDKKTKDFETNFRAFIAAYTDSLKNNSDYADLLASFQNSNNANTAIVNLSGDAVRIFETKRQFILRTKIKPDSADFDQANSTDNIIAYNMDTIEDKKQFILKIINNSASPPVNPFNMIGSIDDIITYNMDTRIEMLLNGLKQWALNPEAVSHVVDEGQIKVYQSDQKINGQNSLVGIAPIINDNKVVGILAASTSLQPIGEAVSVIRQFYIYFYVIALFLIVILSLIYSKMIANPLLALNKTALKISELDFTVKCQVNSQDEIGNLSATLNFLSEKLNTALSELTAVNKQLKEDIEKEKQLEIMRSEFIAGVSHELKTPISLISSYAEGIKDNITKGAKREYYADIIIDETRKMASLVEDMLDLSQLESGTFKLKIEDFPIISLLNSIVERYMANSQIKGKDFDLETNLDDLEVRGDMFRIEQVLTNLIDNAIKYTPFGGAIKISAEDKGDKVLIGIENPGEPIPEAEMQNIWNKFYRIEKSRNKDLGGTGLGLSIVKDILDLHSGEYGVINTAYGVKFYFTLIKKP